MAVITRTHTRTYTLLDAWASTLPWTCGTAGHTHSPMANQVCAIEDCMQLLKAGEECYYVTQLDRDEHGNEQAVCWRHVRPDDGPVSAHAG